MKFLDRQAELTRLNHFAARREGGLLVLFGRRRLGKTRLLVEWCKKKHGVYAVADQSSPALQRRYFAESFAPHFPGFADVTYPDWGSLLRRVASEAADRHFRGPIVVDELPYLVESSPELPSVLQRWVDHEIKAAKLRVVLAGSSQRMMQGLVLDANAPLFGRAQELFQLGPLPAQFAREAFPKLSHTAAVELYTYFGGTPHYWELANECGGHSVEDKVDRLVLDPRGALHREPERLLMEEQPPATALRPILDAIGAGAHRLSEIAGRAGQPATSLARPLQRLLELELIERETPFGELEKNQKRSLYRLADPFFRLWFRVVAPHRSYLTQATADARRALLSQHRAVLLSQTWETLCRRWVAAMPKSCRLHRYGPWKPAQRYWHGSGPEWDLVAHSLDGKHALLGEIKWSDGLTALTQAGAELLAKGTPPGLKNAQVHRAVFLRSFQGSAPAELTVLTPAEILS